MLQEEHRHAGDQGQQPQRGERAEDAQRADRQRQTRRVSPPKITSSRISSTGKDRPSARVMLAGVC